jgi:hypothetical protein
LAEPTAVAVNKRFVGRSGFVAVLTALWTQRVHRPRGVWLVPPPLLCGSVAEVEAQIGQWMRPFSNAKAAAQFLIDNRWRDAGLIGVRDDWTIPVAQLLGRLIYGLDCQSVESFIEFDSRHDDYPDKQFAHRLARAVSEIQSVPPVLIYGNLRGRHGRPELERVGPRAVPIADFAAPNPVEISKSSELSRRGDANHATVHRLCGIQPGLTDCDIGEFGPDTRGSQTW